MKTLYLIRHAKSSWSDSSLMDIERPLNDRGKRDAPRMAIKMREIDPNLQLMISSPALRARKTANAFSKEYPEINDIQIDEDLYHASADDILEVIRSIGGNYDSAAIFGHNPGFTYLANYFAEEYIDNVPTCGIVGVQYEGENWSEVNEDNCKLVLFIYPKMFVD